MDRPAAGRGATPGHLALRSDDHRRPPPSSAAAGRGPLLLPHEHTGSARRGGRRPRRSLLLAPGIRTTDSFADRRAHRSRRRLPGDPWIACLPGAPLSNAFRLLLPDGRPVHPGREYLPWLEAGSAIRFYSSPASWPALRLRPPRRPFLRSSVWRSPPRWRAWSRVGFWTTERKLDP